MFFLRSFLSQITASSVSKEEIDSDSLGGARDLHGRPYNALRSSIPPATAPVMNVTGRPSTPDGQDVQVMFDEIEDELAQDKLVHGGEGDRNTSVPPVYVR